MSNTKVQIVVDDRERPSGIVEELQKHDDVFVKVERLKVGDYHVCDTFLFERKSAWDFAKSLFDGRLFSQASVMLETDSRPVFLIEGSAADWASIAVKREALQGALIALALIFDIPIFRARDPIESAHLILYAGRQLCRLRDPNYLPYHQAKAKRKRTRQLRVLQSLPGVGRHRAGLMLERFGSVRACFTASIEELCSIDGIGEKTAKAIDDVLDERLEPPPFS